MNKSAAMEILAEARQDKRITALIDTRYARNDNGLRVHLILKKGRNDQRSVLLRYAEDWPAQKHAWQDL